ncbi:MAG: hypothetical protein A3J70_05750 [Elusimicrobia bacterium RIFCSPHIGHO2_02_FULL_61_10]|nr:MAG: hypothetical protein A3J70_05750 [Elusimicrobia bacterium RIFCSPHIGHO2_02_FULL_61_10]
MLPTTKVKLLLVTRLKESVPLTVVVEAVAVAMSTVTTCPGLIVTALQAVGTIAGDQVVGADHCPVPALSRLTHASIQSTLLLAS